MSRSRRGKYRRLSVSLLSSPPVRNISAWLPFWEAACDIQAPAGGRPPVLHLDSVDHDKGTVLQLAEDPEEQIADAVDQGGFCSGVVLAAPTAVPSRVTLRFT